MKLKYCKGCGQTKPLSEFYKHRTTHDGLRGKCKDCQREQNRQYRKRNRAKVKRWPSYQTHYHKEKTEEDRKRARRSYRKNRERILEHKRQYRQENLEKLRKRDQQYRENNHEIRQVQYCQRRAREADAEGFCTTRQWKSIKEFYSPDNKCLACGEVGKMTVDHVNPLALGGTNWPENLQPLCLTCNMHKYIKVIDYRPDRGVFARSL